MRERESGRAAAIHLWIAEAFTTPLLLFFEILLETSSSASVFDVATAPGTSLFLHLVSCFPQPRAARAALSFAVGQGSAGLAPSLPSCALIAIT